MYVSSDSSKIVDIYLLIAQYPILAPRIRRQMRYELFRRGIITPERFAEEVREKAILSQQREGLLGLSCEEDACQWEQRVSQVQDHLTDFYFAYNLPIQLLHQLIDNLLSHPNNGHECSSRLSLRFNPELAPLQMVLKQAEKYESLPPEERAAVDHHLQELIVVLLKTMISDQLAFVHIAKRWFTTADFKYVLEHRIGTGKIGGKAAGMLLAYKILQNTAPEIFDQIVLPRSYFVGADVFYDFMAVNHVEFMNQKYKTPEQIRADYPAIQAQYAQARFPEEIADQLRDVLKEMGKTPLIVRSSSLLEDNFGTSFAGKYASFFCPNQGTLKENLRDLTLAIRRTYASVYSPDALIYRRRVGLLDYDERMAILLQEVQGQQYHKYYFPALAGVAYSYSPIVWHPRLRREEGFMRLVLGLGTRAVERVGSDYPRLISLSHPQLRPEATIRAIRHYSQHFVDLLDLERNEQCTLPVQEVLDPDYPALRWVASIDDGETISPPLSVGPHLSPAQLVITFDNLLQRSEFVPLVKKLLARLSEQYHLPVDVEFVVSLHQANRGSKLKFHLLQCRPQNRWETTSNAVRPIAAKLPARDLFFLCNRMVPQGDVSGVEYVVYVEPEAYYYLETPEDYTETARLVGALNKVLENHTFILIGPGRWGSSDYLQGVPITYADIFNTRALVELAVHQRGYTPEPSYGTHFFQDLVESHIYPLAVYPEEPGDYFNWEFVRQATDLTSQLLPPARCPAARCIKVVHIPTERPGHQLRVVMDGQQAVAYLAPKESEKCHT